jgi:hypothetical protein
VADFYFHDFIEYRNMEEATADHGRVVKLRFPDRFDATSAESGAADIAQPHGITS